MSSDTRPEVSPDAARHAAPARSRRAELAAYGVSTLATIACTAYALRLWKANIRVPFAYWGDAVAISMHIKTTLATGWYEYQPLLGAPEGQTFHDYPTADNLGPMMAHVLGLFSSSWPVVLNVYYLIGFPLAALGAMAFLRYLGVGRVFSVMGSTLYAVAPYHFMRNEQHLWLGSYYPVPFALLIVLRVVRGDALWTIRRGSLLRVVCSPAIGTVAAGALVATGSSYYGVFTLALLGVSGVASFVHHKNWRRLVGAATAGIVIVVAMLLNMLPDVLYARQHGEDLGALARGDSGAEVYALKLASLLLPVPGNVVPRLAAIRSHYDSAYPLPSEEPALGTIAALGLVLLLVIAVIQLIQPLSRRAALSGTWSRLVEMSGLTVIAFLFATVGGVSTLISFVTPELRGWNRMSIYIMLFAVAGICLVLDEAHARVAANGRATVASAAAIATAVVLMGAGTLDQAPPAARPDTTATDAQFQADAAWVAQLEGLVGAHAMVFQLPFIPFPESPAVNGVFDTDQLKPFLHSSTLRWSGGAIKGRASSDWPATIPASDAPRAMTELAAAGFSAVVIDTQAYGASAADVEQSWRTAVGDPAIVAVNGRYQVFDLGPTRQRLAGKYSAEQIGAAGRAVTEPTALYPADGTTVAPGSDGTNTWSGPPSGWGFIVDNAATTPVHERLTITSRGATGDATIDAPWGSTVVPAGQTRVLDIEVPPGRSAVSVSASGAPDGASAALGLSLVPVDPAVVSLGS